MTSYRFDDETTSLFTDYQRTKCSRARDALVRRHLWLAERQARRYRGRGELLDDLYQVACVGLVKAVERYDPDRGVPFRAYAVPTMDGELKRHFRDATWSVRVPRRLKDEVSAVRGAQDQLTQELGRIPSAAELADRAALRPGEVVETLDAASAYRTDSLQRRSIGDRSSPRVESDDDAHAEHVLALEAMRDLDPRSREVVYFTYFLQWTQREIGAHLGMGQVQVSRTLRKALAQIRVVLDDHSTQVA